jgi:hypothetical protein
MLNIGASSIVINGRIGAPIQGATVSQVAARVRDDLEANALLIDGDRDRVMLVSCDLMGLTPEFTGEARKRMAEAVNMPERNTIIASTHTHAGPSVVKGPMYPKKPVDTEYLDSLADSLVALAVQTKKTLRPARVGCNNGHAKIGYNRRVCFADGSHEMHGDVKRSRQQIEERGYDLQPWERLVAVGVVTLDDYAKEHASCSVPVHVIRVGDMGIVTQPCELFTHFGLEIKRRSPCKVTAICGNADGIVGYCPTVEAIVGGGFSGRPLFSSKLSHEAGYRMVECAVKLLHQVC